MSINEEIGLGVIGFGSFAMFAVQQFEQQEGVRVAGLAGTHREAAYAAAERFGVGEPIDIEDLVAQEDVDMVYIALPPFLHYDAAKKALEAGKHVLVEKPLAISVEQGRELVALAESRDLLCVVNQMQRYNPLAAQIKAVIDRKPLGEVLYARFENLAADGGLKPDHWFWDREKSGGIFIEHGVHFFDLFAMWFGPGEVRGASRSLRPGSNVEEQVTSMARFGEVDAWFFHSFTQPSRADRQQMRIVFERGEIVTEEWVPTRMTLTAMTGDREIRELKKIFHRAHLEAEELYRGQDRQVEGRFKVYDASEKLTIRKGWDQSKYSVYSNCVRSLFADQWAWIRNRENQRLLTEQDGLRALEMAEAADRMARQGSPGDQGSPPYLPVEG
ncbi:MAG: Gfo/Idh/MocA family oxidoreductase [Fimbriimonadaceae bacterium]|nr:Gfo/Idh/MocA family oxidoreductase [Fimbriimonadaceae bacterium]QYK55200.1 MAG: Gfo/Idh/MocA family oxidoreductase [Fimbriimonadaceae bacterium]